MKTPRLIIFISACLLCLNLSAQEAARDTLSEQYPIEVINGKKVYRYAVKQAEGLWRISKNFNVTQEEIIALNPELRTTGLRFGQEIFIPVNLSPDPSPEGRGDTAGSNQQSAASADSTMLHYVVKGETLYSLAKRYGVKVEDLEELNPNVKRRGLKADQVIRVPRDLSPDPSPKERGESTVSSQPSASSDQQSAVSSQPSAEEAIRIAKDVMQQAKDIYQQSAVSNQQSAVTNPASVWSDDITRHSVQSMPLPVDSNMLAIPLRIAILLPFCTETVKRDANLNRFMEFYQGALLALKVLQDEGMSFEIYVYDTEKGEDKMQQILSRPEMRNIDAIIGPAYPAQVDIAARFAKENKIPLLIPFTSKVSDINSNPYLIQFNPTDELVNNVIADYLSERELVSHAIFVNTPFAEPDNNLPELSRLLTDKGIAFDVIDANVILNDSLSSRLDSTRHNIIFFDTDKQQAAMNYMRRIEAASRKYQISIFGKQTWQLKNIRVPVLYNTVFAAADSKSENLNIRQYNALYQYYYRQQPTASTPRYDMLGYDLTSYLVEILRQGTEQPLHKRAAMTFYQGLQSDIHCIPVSSESGCINNEMEIR